MKNVEFDRRVLEQLRASPKERRREVGAVVSAVQEAFGRPHQHAGLGLRKLRSRHYEVRLGLGRRLVFEDRGAALHFKRLGNHGEVQRFLKGWR